MAHSTPLVSDDGLTISTGAHKHIIPLGSAAWWHWLDAAETTTFHFKNDQGSFTARRERKNGNWYWYAYRKQHGKLHKAYLGKTAELALERLNTIAQFLNEQAAEPPAPPLVSRHASQPPVTSADDAQPETDMPALLLTTRLYQPPVRPDLVERPHLFSRLTAGLQCKLTLVTAPAGFGKTTLLSAWCSQHNPQIPHAWLSLDDNDNDLLRFLAYFVAALQLISPALSQQLTPLLRALPPPPIEALLTITINLLMRVPQPFCLILDDYHAIKAQPIHDALSFLLEHLPPHMHLFIASRSEPPLPLIRLRAQGQLNELQASDLRFTLDEVATFLQQVMELDLSLSQIKELDAHTEGWVAGLQLAALSLQGQHNVQQFLATFNGSHRYIMEYLTGEVLQRQPAHIRDFLLYTSLLDRLNGPLCSAVTGQSDGATTLSYLEQANLFVIPLDEQRHWYRYHHLFAEVLRVQLQQTQPELVPRLHIRAANWYEEHALLSEAMHHIQEAHDEERAACVIEQHAETMMMIGESVLLLHWCRQLSEESLRNHPNILIYYAASLISIGQLNAAERYLQLARESIDQLKVVPEISREAIQELKGLYFLCQTARAGYRGDVPETLEFAEKTRRFLPEKSSLRSLIPASLGAAYLYTGDFMRANQAFTDAMNQGFSTHHMHSAIASMAGQGYMQQTEGHLHQAAETYRQVIQIGSSQGDQVITGISMAYTFLSELYYEWNDLDVAEQHAREALQLGQHWGYAPTLSHSYTIQAYIQLARGNKAEALAYMQHAAQIVHEHNLPQNALIVEAYQAWLQQQAGETEAAARWANAVLERQQTDLSYPYDLEHTFLAQILFVQGDMLRLHDLLSRLLPAIETSGRQRLLLAVLVLKVHFLQAQGKQEQAITLLEHILTLAEPEGYIRTFLDWGTTLLPLLRHILHRGTTATLRTYIHTLLDATGATETILTPENILSEREIAVLHCVAAGKSNQEIAQEFVVALSTVKTHLNNLYSKLGVHSRTQAIARAKELQILQ